MDTTILSNNYHIHFIGVGGVSMAGLCKIAKSLDFSVSGSDINENELTRSLENEGVSIYYSHASKNVKNASAVVYTSAIKKSNIELETANLLGILTLTRAEFLQMISKKFPKSIAISGCHGKTTTTAMVSDILLTAKLDPTIHIGANWDRIDGSARLGESEFFVTEACEYNRSFLALTPYVSAILNIDFDHPDYYYDYEDIFSAYDEFSHKATSCVLTTPSIKAKLSSKKKVVTCGLTTECFYHGENIINKEGKYGFTLYRGKNKLGKIQLNILGEHNLTNAIFAAAICDIVGVPFTAIENSLSLFSGLSRRLELVHNQKQLTIYSDYAHHPTEITKTISAVLPLSKPIIAVFQPHTYSRTKYLLNQFKTSFSGIDKLIIYNTFSAREEYSKDGSAKTLFDSINHPDKHYFDTETDMQSYLAKVVTSENILLFLGAGDVDKFAKNFAKL